MDAVELIKQHHRRIEELFGKFLETESDMTQEDLYQRIQTALDTHAAMEERILYPALKQFVPAEVKKSIKAHATIKRLLAELSGANEQSFVEEFTELMDDVRRHIESEESAKGLLAAAQRHLTAVTLSQMAIDMNTILHGGQNLAA